MKNLIAVPLIMAVLLAAAPVVFGADTPKMPDAAGQAKRRAERERQFLYRTVEDLTRSQEYVQLTVRGLEKQVDAVDILEPARRERDISTLLAWYRSYAEWLGNNLADFEEDLSRAYSNERSMTVTPERYHSLRDGYSHLGSQLEEQVSHLEKLLNRTEDRISVLRMALDYIASAAFIEERGREKKQEHKHSEPRTDRRHTDELYERYKDITDAEIAIMQSELKNLGELQKHYLVLLELGRMELSWVVRKTSDYEALGRLAGVVGRDAPAPLEEAGSRMIKLYESDIVFFKRMVDDISRARARIVPSGTMRSLDRMEELSENYDQMRSRLEHHMTWLAEQAGAYRADLIDVRRDK